MKAGGNAVPGDRVAVPGTDDMVVLKGRPTLSALKRVQRQVRLTDADSRAECSSPPYVHAVFILHEDSSAPGSGRNSVPFCGLCQPGAGLG